MNLNSSGFLSRKAASRLCWIGRELKCVFCSNNTRSGRSYVATDQYPGPPIDGEARQLGSTRLPSYNRAVRHQSRANRTPPPEYKHYNYQGN